MPSLGQSFFDFLDQGKVGSMKVQGAYNTVAAARYLNVSRRTLQKLLDDKQIQFKQVGRRRIIPKQALDQWLMGEQGGDQK